MTPTIQIFVSSPGDVYQERVAAERVINRLRDRYASDAIIVPVMWEHEPMTANDNFQNQIFSPALCDIVVILLWARMGTRLPKSVGADSNGNEYPSGTAYEFATSFERYLVDGAPEILIYKKTSQYIPESDDADVLEKAASQKRSLEQFMAQLLTEDGLPKNAYSTFEDNRRFEETLEVHLQTLIERKLFGQVVITPTWHGNPFLGLRAFDLQHAPVYFGRQVATERALSQLQARTAAGVSSLLIVGASGSGKSSLLRSGLASRILADHHDMPHVVLRLGSALPSSPVVQLSQLIEAAVPSVKPFRIRELLEHNPAAVPSILRGIHHSSNAEPTDGPHLLLLIDQLEELLTLSFDGDQQRKFATAIDLLARSGVCWCIASIRSDHYASLAGIPELSHFTENGGVFDLLPPTKAEIGQMIRRPARAAGLYFEENRQTGQSLDDLIRDDAADHVEVLPLLEFTLDELYMRRSDKGQLTFEAYKRLGGIEGSVSRRADEVYWDFSPEVRNSLAGVFRQLVTVSVEGAIPTRQQSPDAVFDENSAARQLVDAFVEARLLSRNVRDGEPVVELVHEALLKRWIPLQQWLLRETELLRQRTRLSEKTQQWLLNGESDELLLPKGKPLEEAEEVVAELDLIPRRSVEDVSRFTRLSQQRIRRRRLYEIYAVAALCILTVVSITTAFVARRFEKEASNNAMIAQKNENIADFERQESQRFRIAAEFQAELATTRLRQAQATANDVISIVRNELGYARHAKDLRVRLTEKSQGLLDALIDSGDKTSDSLELMVQNELLKSQQASLYEDADSRLHHLLAAEELVDSLVSMSVVRSSSWLLAHSVHESLAEHYLQQGRRADAKAAYRSSLKAATEALNLAPQSSEATVAYLTAITAAGAYSEQSVETLATDMNQSNIIPQLAGMLEDASNELPDLAEQMQLSKLQQILVGLPQMMIAPRAQQEEYATNIGDWVEDVAAVVDGMASKKESVSLLEGVSRVAEASVMLAFHLQSPSLVKENRERLIRIYRKLERKSPSDLRWQFRRLIQQLETLKGETNLSREELIEELLQIEVELDRLLVTEPGLMELRALAIDCSLFVCEMYGHNDRAPDVKRAVAKAEAIAESLPRGNAELVRGGVVRARVYSSLARIEYGKFNFQKAIELFTKSMESYAAAFEATADPRWLLLKHNVLLAALDAEFTVNGGEKRARVLNELLVALPDLYKGALNAPEINALKLDILFALTVDSIVRMQRAEAIKHLLAFDVEIGKHEGGIELQKMLCGFLCLALGEKKLAAPIAQGQLDFESLSSSVPEFFEGTPIDMASIEAFERSVNLRSLGVLSRYFVHDHSGALREGEKVWRRMEELDMCDYVKPNCGVHSFFSSWAMAAVKDQNEIARKRCLDRLRVVVSSMECSSARKHVLIPILGELLVEAIWLVRDKQWKRLIPGIALVLEVGEMHEDLVDGENDSWLADTVIWIYSRQGFRFLLES